MPIKPENKILYPSNWKFIRADILIRAKNRCEICQVKNKEGVLRGTYQGVECFQDMDGNIYRTDNGDYIDSNYVGDIEASESAKWVGIVLTIAHLDHNPENNCYSNLQCLCQLHHLRHDIHQHRESRRKTKLKKQPELFPSE